MRLRKQRRVAKILSQHPRYRFEAACVQVELRKGLSFRAALLAVIRDHKQQHCSGRLAKLMAEYGDRAGIEAAIARFFTSQGHLEIYTSALVLEETGDRHVQKVLHDVLDNDSNADRRHGAARALGWMYPVRVTPDIERSLARFLSDTSPSPDARADAAESLRWGRDETATAALIEGTKDAQVVVRFFAIFALGSRKPTSDVVSALEACLKDHEELNTYWSVAKEALATLGSFRPTIRDYRAKLEEECARIFSDKAASAADKRWAKSYGT